MEFVSVCGRLDPASGPNSARALIGRLYSGLPRDDTRQVQASTAPVAASVHPRRELRIVSPPRAYSSIGGGHRALAVDHPGLLECPEHIVEPFAIDLDRAERVEHILSRLQPTVVLDPTDRRRL